MSIWPVAGILAMICVAIAFSMKRNAIWAGLQIGVLTAVLVAMIMKHDALNHPVSKKIVVAAVLVGSAFELISQLKGRRFFQQ